MPGPMTHYIFYQRLKERLNQETRSAFPQYDDYSIYAQGHDLFIYHDFYKIHNSRQLKANIELSKQLQECSFQEFVYQYFKMAEEMQVIQLPEVRLFMEAGYIGHHILDAYTHPLIIYLSGDHVRDARRKTWRHGIAENLLDIYMIERAEGVQSKFFPAHRKFQFCQKKMSRDLTELLNRSIEKVYGFSKGGEIIREATSQVSSFMRIFKYDPTGMKKIIFDVLDPILKGTASFSYHRDVAGAKAFLNSEHEVWINPMEKTLRSKESFMDLFDRALTDCAGIMEKLEALFRKGTAEREDITSIVPDVASTHGLPCGNALEIRYTKEVVSGGGDFG